MKAKKLLIILGSVTTLAMPIATLVSCGSTAGTPKFAYNHVPVVKTSSYTDSIGKVLSKDITVAGGFSDIRTLASNKTDAYNLTAPIGVETQRIANDGIQVKGNMAAGDQWNIQQLFKKIIEDPSGPTITVHGKKESVFKVYSHSDYAVPKKTIPYINKGKPAEKSRIGGTIAPLPTGTVAKFKKNVGVTKITDIPYSDFATNSKLNILFIPSNDPSSVTAASNSLAKFLNDRNIKVNIQVANDYNAAASQLNTGKIDMAFLPTDTWAEGAPKSNFILQAARDAQVATLNVSGATAVQPSTTINNEEIATLASGAFGQLHIKNLPLIASTPMNKWVLKGMEPEVKAFKAAYNAAKPTDPFYALHDLAHKAIAYRKTEGLKPEGFKATNYESMLYARKDSKFSKEVMAALKKQGSNWKLNWKLTKDIKYGYTSTTSSASYVFPELWFIKHFNDK